MDKIETFKNRFYQQSSIEQLQMTFSLGAQENPEIIFKKGKFNRIENCENGGPQKFFQGKGVAPGVGQNHKRAL